MAFNEDFSYSASGNVKVQAPNTVVRVSAILVGTEKITSCGTVRLSGRLSKGGAGRDMTYTWSVSAEDSSATASVDSIQDVLNGIDGKKQFTVRKSLLNCEL